MDISNDKQANSHPQKTWTWLRKGYLKREIESLLIAGQNNSIRTNSVKAKTDKTEQNSRCRLCGDRGETINHIKSECSKLAQKEFKNRKERVREMIPWELCKKNKFDHKYKYYMYDLEHVLENEMHKL